MKESNYWQRLQQSRVNRRYILGAGATTALGAAAGLIVGCSSGSDTPSNGNGTTKTPKSDFVPSVGPPQPGGEIVQGFLLNILGIDPHVDLTGLFIVPFFYNYLYSWRPFAEEPIYNELVKPGGLEIPDPEALTFIYNLQPGIKAAMIADNPGGGEELTSEDVKQSFYRRGTSITAVDKRFAIRICGSKDTQNNLLPSLLTPDPYTFTFTMKDQFIPAVREVSNPTWAIIQAKTIEKWGRFGPNGLGQKARGGGAFILDEFNGYEKIVMHRNPDYFLNPRPWIDKWTFVIISDPSSLLAAFDSRAHDIGGALMNKKQAQDRSEEGNRIISGNPTRFYPCVHFKMRGPWADLRVRKAFDLAMDRDQQIQVIWDGEGNYNGPVQWLMQRFALPQEELRSFQKFDPEEARRLLAEAGYGDGIEAKLRIPRVPGAPFIADLATMIKDQAGKVGINLVIDEVELGTFIVNVILPGNFDVAFFPNLPYDEPDRPLSFYHSLGITGTGNWNNYTNKELDALIDAQSRDFDEPHRIETIHAAQRIALKEYGPQITLPSGNFYLGRWNYIHAPNFGEDLPIDAGPQGSDVWTEEEV